MNDQLTDTGRFMTTHSGVHARKGLSMRSIFTKFIAISTLTIVGTANADMGRTAGSWGVSPSGAATYTVPIWFQPGPKGIQPSFSFSYNSQSGNGTMGVGWGLSGFGSI